MREVAGIRRRTATGEDELEREGDETWVEWIRRATERAGEAATRAKVVDLVEEQRRRQWRWAGHVARRTDGRRPIDWEPVQGARRPGRPMTRWEDPLVRFAQEKGFSWRELAKNRSDWDQEEAEFSRKSW